MKFVDRKREIERLESVLAGQEAKMVVIYGRRRVGKSTLIKQVLKGKTSVYFQADETEQTNQLSLLANVIGQCLPGFENVVYPNWYSLLEAFNHRVEPGTTLCLDEFPYLVKTFPALPSVLQNFWDNQLPKFNLILCGSSQRAMYSELLNENSPLYGRSDCTMKLQPISLGYLLEAMDISSPQSAVEYYAVWGGIPRYWKLCKDSGTFDESFRRLLLEPEAMLTDEPNRLLRDDMRDLTLSRTILSVIGSGANRMSEIANRVGKRATEISGPLKKLVDMGYIMREVPFGESFKSSKKSLYKIKDQFLNTYYNFVAPNASLITLGRTRMVWNTVSANLTSFVGNAWEAMCRDAVSGNFVFDTTFGLASRWWGSIPNKEKRTNEEIEIDVMAESADGENLLIGECKWTGHEDGARVLEELKSKAQKLPFINNYKSVKYVLFLREEPLIKPECQYLLPGDIINISRQEDY